jgi:hypothetical protein
MALKIGSVLLVLYISNFSDPMSGFSKKAIGKIAEIDPNVEVIAKAGTITNLRTKKPPVEEEVVEETEEEFEEYWQTRVSDDDYFAKVEVVQDITARGAVAVAARGAAAVGAARANADVVIEDEDDNASNVSALSGASLTEEVQEDGSVIITDPGNYPQPEDLTDRIRLCYKGKYCIVFFITYIETNSFIYHLFGLGMGGMKPVWLGNSNSNPGFKYNNNGTEGDFSFFNSSYISLTHILISRLNHQHPS